MWRYGPAQARPRRRFADAPPRPQLALRRRPVTAGAAHAAPAEVARAYAAPDSPIAVAVAVPPGYGTVYVSGATAGDQRSLGAQGQRRGLRLDRGAGRGGAQARPGGAAGPGPGPWATSSRCGSIWSAIRPTDGQMDFNGMVRGLPPALRHRRTSPIARSRTSVQVAALVAAGPAGRDRDHRRPSRPRN